jgi:hypothetical protein
MLIYVYMQIADKKRCTRNSILKQLSQVSFLTVSSHSIDFNPVTFLRLCGEP